MKINIKPILLMAVTFAFSHSTWASYVELNSGTYCCSYATGETTGRGISFQANSTFSIDSVGIFGDLYNKSYDVVIYSSTDGHQVNNILNTASAVSGGTGNSWNDVAVNFTFNASDYYLINWTPSDLQTGWVNTSLDYYQDSALPAVAGPVTLIDGTAGAVPDFSNTLHPNLRVNVSTVPVPAAIWLFGSGLIGLIGVVAGRKKA